MVSCLISENGAIQPYRHSDRRRSSLDAPGALLWWDRLLRWLSFVVYQYQVASRSAESSDIGAIVERYLDWGGACRPTH